MENKTDTHQTPAEQGEAAARKDAQRNLPEPWQSTDELGAADAYDQRQGRVLDLIEALTDASEKHAKQFLWTNRKNWNYCGDLARVERLLAEAVQTLGGTTAADNEAWGF